MSETNIHGIHGEPWSSHGDSEPWSRANSQDLPGALATHRPTAVGIEADGSAVAGRKFQGLRMGDLFSGI
jgi:hypothetical protein